MTFILSDNSSIFKSLMLLLPNYASSNSDITKLYRIKSSWSVLTQNWLFVKLGKALNRHKCSIFVNSKFLNKSVYLIKSLK